MPWDCSVIVLKYFPPKHFNAVILESCCPKRGVGFSSKRWWTKQNEESTLNPKRDCNFFLWRLPWIIARAVSRSLHIVSWCLRVGWGVFSLLESENDHIWLLKQLVFQSVPVKLLANGATCRILTQRMQHAQKKK